MKSINVTTDNHDELSDRKERIAEVLDVPERKVTFNDALQTFLHPTDWNGLDREEIVQRR